MENGKNLTRGNDVGGDGGRRREEEGLPDGGKPVRSERREAHGVLKYHGTVAGVRDADRGQ